MQRRTNMLSTVVLSATMCFGASAIAADTPTSGTDTYMTYQTLSGWNSLKMGSTEFATYELNGSRAVATACSIIWACTVLARSWDPEKNSGHRRGACTVAEKDGDQFSWTYDGKAIPAT